MMEPLLELEADFWSFDGDDDPSRVLALAQPR